MSMPPAKTRRDLTLVLAKLDIQETDKRALVKCFAMFINQH